MQLSMHFIKTIQAKLHTGEISDRTHHWVEVNFPGTDDFRLVLHFADAVNASRYADAINGVNVKVDEKEAA